MTKTNAVLRGNSYAGNPHLRFDEGGIVKNLQRNVLAGVGFLLLSIQAMSAQAVEVISSDATTTNSVATLPEAFAAVEAGGMIRLTEDMSNVNQVTNSRVCTLDLNGKRLEFKSGVESLIVTRNAQLTLTGGGFVSGDLSIFNLAENAQVTVQQCEMLGRVNLFYAGGSAAKMFIGEGTKVKTQQVVSKWSKTDGRLYLCAGSIVETVKIDDNDNADTPLLVVEGGRVSRECSRMCAEGKYLKYEQLIVPTTFLGNLTMRFRVINEAEYVDNLSICEAIVDRSVYPQFLTAVSNAIDKSHVTLLKDFFCTGTLTFPRSAKFQQTFDMGGHVLSGASDCFYRVQGNVVVSNGTILLDVPDKTKTYSAIFLNEPATYLRLDSTVTIDTSCSTNHLVFVYNASDSTYICDGCTIRGKLYSTWNSSNIKTSSLILTNDVSFSGGEIGYSKRVDDTVRIYGGNYNVNPSKFLGDGCAIYHTNTVAALPYFVTPFACQTFDAAVLTPPRVFTSIPSGVNAVEVIIAGDAKGSRNRILADFTNVAGYEALSFDFALDRPRPKGVALSYGSGLLSLCSRGLVLIFK